MPTLVTVSNDVEEVAGQSQILAKALGYVTLGKDQETERNACREQTRMVEDTREMRVDEVVRTEKDGDDCGDEETEQREDAHVLGEFGKAIVWGQDRMTHSWTIDLPAGDQQD